METLESRLERLVKKGRITMQQAFVLNRKLLKKSRETQSLYLDSLEEGSKTAEQVLEQLEQAGSDHHHYNDPDFQQFKKRMKEFGKEVGSEIESLVSDFDKERFKTNLQSLFTDLSETFKGKPGQQDRTVHGDYNEQDLVVLDQLVIKGKAKFKKLTIQGTLTVEESLEADKIEGSGRLQVMGDLTCKTMDFEGQLTIQGDLQTGSFHNRGRTYLKGDYSGADMSNEGTFNCQGDMQLIRLENQGSLSADRSLRADRVISTGILNCLGMMRSGLIDMNEGRVIMMEADQVRLGKDCRVEDLAYKVSCELDEGAKVNRKKKIS